MLTYCPQFAKSRRHYDWRAKQENSSEGPDAKLVDGNAGTCKWPGPALGVVVVSLRMLTRRIIMGEILGSDDTQHTSRVKQALLVLLV